MYSAVGVLHPRNVWLNPMVSPGVFLLNGPNSRQFPAASESFLKALDDSHVPARTLRRQAEGRWDLRRSHRRGQAVS